MHRHFAIGFLIDFFGQFFSIFKPGVFAIEECNFIKSIQCGLRCNRRSCSAGAGQNELFSFNFDSFINQRLNETDSVRIMSGQNAVIVDDRIDRLDDFGSRRQFVHVLNDRSFIWHRNVCPAHLEHPDRINCAFNRVSINVKTQIRIIDPELVKCSVVHRR